MKYPLYTVSKPVSDREVQKLAHALNTGGYVANGTALASAKRIVARHYRRKAAKFAGVDFSDLPVEYLSPD